MLIQLHFELMRPADFITHILLSPAFKRSILLMRPVAFTLIADALHFFSFTVSVLLTSASSASNFLLFFFSFRALSLVGLQRLFRLGTRLPPPSDSGQGHTRHKKMRTRRFIIILGRSAYPAPSRTNANFSPFPSLSRSLTRPFVSRCLCVCRSLSLLSHQAQR